MENPDAGGGTSGQANTALGRLLNSLSRDLRGIYRPERHYMRGPGPKWREKHPAAGEPSSGSIQSSKAG